MRALFLVIDLALELYIWIVIAAAIFSWLVAFHVVNTRNQVVGMIGEFLYRITEPALRPIRNLLPNLGGIDISPVILFLIIIFIRYVIALYILPNVYLSVVTDDAVEGDGGRRRRRRAADAARRPRRHRRDRAPCRWPRRLKARVRVAPSDGEANSALCRLIADALDIAPRHVTVAAGATSRVKRIRVTGRARRHDRGIATLGREKLNSAALAVAYRYRARARCART